eukprot:maker-scaffold_15-snap-gene-1.34-mRNA-1 protein AED:0.23 eAED:0.46 QI:0/0/0.5/1/0/0/2/515/95
MLYLGRRMGVVGLLLVSMFLFISKSKSAFLFKSKSVFLFVSKFLFKCWFLFKCSSGSWLLVQFEGWFSFSGRWVKWDGGGSSGGTGFAVDGGDGF